MKIVRNWGRGKGEWDFLAVCRLITSQLVIWRFAPFPALPQNKMVFYNRIYYFLFCYFHLYHYIKYIYGFYIKKI